jgi:hypothetical protein
MASGVVLVGWTVQAVPSHRSASHPAVPPVGPPPLARPMAMQAVDEVHDTLLSSPPATAGMVSWVHRSPSHRSASVVAAAVCVDLVDPTATQLEGDVQETDRSDEVDWSGIGAGCTAHDVPFQRVASAVSAAAPTAKQSSAAGQDTPNNRPVRSSGGINDQRWPSHRSVRGRSSWPTTM